MDVIVALLIALAGGLAGAVLTLLAGVPEQVRHHNRLVAEYDDDLGQWVSDEMVRLERRIARHRTEMASRGQHDSGAYLRGIAHLKEEALHAYRDQLAAVERKRAALQDAEGTRHCYWRRWVRAGALPVLESPARARPLLDLWRHEVERHGATAPVSDPTKRSLQWALDKYATPEGVTRGWPEGWADP